MDLNSKINQAFDADEMPKWLSVFTKSAVYSNNVIAGINDDDCAIIQIGGEQIVITTDYLNANPIALELDLGSYWDLGRILVASNLSDLCGTGALPTAFLTSIMLNKNNVVEANFKALMSGVKFELDKHNIPLVGGDTKLGMADSFCGIAIGMREKHTKLLIKNAALVGDSIWVSGNLGGVASAIEGLRIKNMPQKWNDWAKKKIIDPELPLTKSRLIAQSMLGNGGTDVSDGLGANLWHLCEASNLGAIINVEAIPLDEEVRQLADAMSNIAWMYSLTIGGDFQFIFTSDKGNDEKIASMGFFKIGETIKEKEAYITFNDVTILMPKMGHRDVRMQSFSDEVKSLIDNIKLQIKHD